jgi:predicted AAA+ superfamily ATPase
LELYREVRERLAGAVGRCYILLDEIQQVPGWERAVASFTVDLDCDVVVTGSNSSLLSSDFATHIAGRYLQLRLFPLSFAEYRLFDGTESAFADFDAYLRWGGMPGIHELPDDEHARTTYLNDVFDSVLLKDVVARHRIRDVELLERLVAFLMANLGHQFSAKRITDFLKSQHRSAGTDTIHNYLEALRSAYAVHKVPRWDIKGKKLFQTQEKYFLEDHGLRHARLGFAQEDLPGVLENIAYLELARRGFTVKIGHIATKEVDFIAERQNERHYFQVAYLLTDQTVIDRELAPLQAIDDNYPKYLLSLDQTPDSTIQGIQRRNLARWLLDD